MKLTAAKCPSCGANLEVDRNEEYIVCKYCHSNILIEDAVEKYKLEITGKIKVSGIKDNDDRLMDAKKYLKLEEYENANAVLNTIINTDPFNTQAYILCIKSYLGQFQKIYDKENYKTDNELNKAFWKDVDFILSTYDRLQSIDEKGSYKAKLKEEILLLTEMQKERDALEEDLQLCIEIDNIIEEITSYKFTPKISKSVNRNYKKINKLVKSYFINTLGLDILKVPDSVRCFYRNLEIKYYDSSSKFRTDSVNMYTSISEVHKALEETKDEIMKQIEKSATTSSPVGLIKGILNKN